MQHKRYFFILGKPRCRTAWFSALLTHDGTLCLHEGMSGFASFEDYAAYLRSRPESVVGDACPALVCHIDKLRTEFPEAPIIVLDRPAENSLNAFLRSLPGKYDIDGIRAGFPEYLQHFDRATKGLPLFDVHELDSKLIFGICQQILRVPVSLERINQFQRLRITSGFPDVVQTPLPSPLGESSVRCVLDRMHMAGFKTDDLEVSYFDPERDSDMIEGWYLAHNQTPMPVIGLPPLGIVIHDEQGPAGALWCFETFGTGVAWLEFPVTRPGLSVAESSRILSYGVAALTELAGKGFDPPAVFNRFRIQAPASMARILKRLGFIESKTTRMSLILTT